MEHCEECGFTYDELPAPAVPEALRSLAPRYRDRLTAPVAAGDLDARLRAHPFPGVWSELEYACHLRDVLSVQRDRLRLALAEHRPTFAPMGREERVGRDRYNHQEPAAVAQEIDAAAEDLAAALASLDDDQWQRVAVYNWPAPAPRTMAWLARHTVHEGEHHLADMDRLRAASGGPGGGPGGGPRTGGPRARRAGGSGSRPLSGRPPS
ncbi:MAG: DinB family protein, partial [Acidimicrobiales bacterium]